MGIDNILLQESLNGKLLNNKFGGQSFDMNLTTTGDYNFLPITIQVTLKDKNGQVYNIKQDTKYIY